jgi:hypothetical protein
MFRAVGDKLIQDHFACPINNQIRSVGSLKFQWNLITGQNLDNGRCLSFHKDLLHNSVNFKVK